MLFVYGHIWNTFEIKFTIYTCEVIFQGEIIKSKCRNTATGPTTISTLIIYLE